MWIAHLLLERDVDKKLAALLVHLHGVYVVVVHLENCACVRGLLLAEGRADDGPDGLDDHLREGGAASGHEASRGRGEGNVETIAKGTTGFFLLRESVTGPPTRPQCPCRPPVAGPAPP